MTFSKNFPHTIKGSHYPQWEEVSLTEQEEKEVEEKCRQENIRLFKECLEDAQKIMQEKNLKDYQTDLISITIALFEKRAEHAVYWKESKAKEKFDQKFK